jgi:hypothetical protein
MVQHVVLCRSGRRTAGVKSNNCRQFLAPEEDLDVLWGFAKNGDALGE